MIVHRYALRRPLEHLAGVSDGLDPAVRDEDGAILDIGVRRSARRGGVVLEGEDAPADEARAGAQERISLILRAAIRSISSSAVRVSASASLARRRSKAARMSDLLLPLTAMMKGKPKRVL